MTNYEPIIEQLNAAGDGATVVAEYQRKYESKRNYESEAELERGLIEQLVKNGYEYQKDINNSQKLAENLRVQLERLNGLIYKIENFKLSDKEWEQVFNAFISNQNEGIAAKSKKIQEDYIYALKRDLPSAVSTDRQGQTGSGEMINIYLLDKDNIHNNFLQVINQYQTTGANSEGAERKTRYDVTILVNGLPLVHIELKRRGVELKEAFNQITRYQEHSFWADDKLYQYVQLFVISNGTHSKYYSNTTRELAHKEEKGQNSNSKKTSNSFEFTNWWADANNKGIYDLRDFTDTFFTKSTLLNILLKYCVFTADEMLLVMRPYQIAATERILNQILIASNDKKKLGTVEAGGYIWHTTGSGKTLTSFKTARLASRLDYVDKVLFVVDRKDLDYQTMKEYDKFEKGAANSNTSTRILEQQLKDPSKKIIITTIQKLTHFVNRRTKDEDSKEVFNGKIVMIFDECHRSQFGDMHLKITKAFKNYMIFGCTGTPIFATNTTGDNKYPNLSADRQVLKTTDQVFGRRLHTYTIVDAINDKNVLPFKVDYINTVKSADGIEDEDVYDIQREEALLNDARISEISNYLLKNFAVKTRRDRSYELRLQNNDPLTDNRLTVVEKVEQKGSQDIDFKKGKSRRVLGFNSIFATASIKAAKKYYQEIKRQQQDLPEIQRLKVALIYSYGVNEDSDLSAEQAGDLALDGVMDENNENTEQLSKNDRDFLESAIQDYNGFFGTNFDTSSDKFQNYYKDLSLRVKNRDVDLLIVVNMFLTGFDATTLNTLWVDKRLRSHGLIQAFSRTNRILNSIKSYGNVVCFRNLEKQVNEAVALFGDKDAAGIVLLKSYQEYLNGYKETIKDSANSQGIEEVQEFPGYLKLVEQLREKFPIAIETWPEGEQYKKEFIAHYNNILKVRNILLSFDGFENDDPLSEGELQDYQGLYLQIREEFVKPNSPEAVDIVDDLVFELELIKSQEVNIDYILLMVKNYHQNNCEDKQIEVKINKAVDSALQLRKKKALILAFVNSISAQTGDVDEAWIDFVKVKRIEELNQLIDEENLNPEETYKFVSNAFKQGYVQSTGTELGRILPPSNPFDKSGNSLKKRESVLEKINLFFEKFFDISDERI